MNSFLLVSILLLVVAMMVGLWRSYIGPSLANRLLSVQLLGSGGVALCVLFASALQRPALIDVALVFALLAAISAIALSQRALHKQVCSEEES